MLTTVTATPEPPTSATARPYVQCDNLVRIYKTADLEVVALQGLDLQVRRGEMMAIIGNSGSGKTTLMNILGGLDRPTAGRCFVGDLDLVQASESDLVLYKRHKVGFVWQQSSRNIIPYLNALENVQAPMLFANGRRRKERARNLLERVGLADRMHHRLSQLSGGQQQRVAIAIALANEPELILADEPTGEVDTQTAARIYEIFRELNREAGVTVIVVSHDRNIASRVDRVVAIRDGRTSTETVRRVSVNAGEEHTHDEFVIVDDTGRLQVPREMLQRVGIHGRAVVELEEDSVVIRSESAGRGVRIVDEEFAPEAAVTAPPSGPAAPATTEDSGVPAASVATDAPVPVSNEPFAVYRGPVKTVIAAAPAPAPPRPADGQKAAAPPAGTKPSRIPKDHQQFVPPQRRKKP